MYIYEKMKRRQAAWFQIKREEGCYLPPEGRFQRQQLLPSTLCIFTRASRVQNPAKLSIARSQGARRLSSARPGGCARGVATKPQRGSGDAKEEASLPHRTGSQNQQESGPCEGPHGSFRRCHYRKGPALVEGPRSNGDADVRWGAAP
jgi:hypothetical protein